MIEIIHSGTYKARKIYSDDAYWAVREVIEGYRGIENLDKLSEEEKESLRKVVSSPSPRLINIGDTYVRQFNTDGGDTWIWRSKEIIHKVYIRYKLFEE